MHFEADRARGRWGGCLLNRSGCVSVVMLNILVMMVGCARKSAGGGEAGTKGRSSAGGAAVPVVTAPVVKKAMPVELASIGAVESTRAIAVKSLVTGTLIQIDFQEGQDVKKGDLLFTVDPRPFENVLRAAEADHEKTTAQLEMADAEVRRYSALVAGGLVSKEQFQNLEINSHALRAMLVGNQVAIANAKLQLDYCYIHAPCDGRTGSLGAHEGDLVRANDPNISLVTVTQLAPIYVTFTLPQQDLPRLRRYQAAGTIGVVARASAPDAPGENGELSFIDSAVDATSGTIRLKATFANAQHGLWPGQFVRVNLTLATLPDQIVVPTPAVQIGQRGQQVYVVRPDKTVELRPITVDRTEGTDSVISKGLRAGEMVVVDGQLRLRPNSAVEIRPPVEDVPAVRGGAGKSRRAMTAGGSESPPEKFPAENRPGAQVQPTAGMPAAPAAAAGI